MRRCECIAMLLAGGQGSRLSALTRKLAKPAIPFGAKYRIIDFTLSNCSNSGIDVIGVLTQYQPLVLTAHVGVGEPWGLDTRDGRVAILPPYVDRKGGAWYKGTASAVFQNIEFVEQFRPRYVLVISGDHVYKMNYARMLRAHRDRGSEVTIAAIEVPWQETSRFGIIVASSGDRITEFQEKPSEAKSNLASMGVYAFNWELLKAYLEKDEKDAGSTNDFGRDVIPAMLRDGRLMHTFRFAGYWRDVGTVESLWSSHMDLLEDKPALDLYDAKWPVYTVNQVNPPQFIAPEAMVHRTLVGGGCSIFGRVERSVVFSGVHIARGAVIRDSVVMTDCWIGPGARIERSVIGPESQVRDGLRIGTPYAGGAEITLIGERTVVVTDVPERSKR